MTRLYYILSFILIPIITSSSPEFVLRANSTEVNNSTEGQIYPPSNYTNSTITVKSDGWTTAKIFFKDLFVPSSENQTNATTEITTTTKTTTTATTATTTSDVPQKSVWQMIKDFFSFSSDSPTKLNENITTTTNMTLFTDRERSNSTISSRDRFTGGSDLGPRMSNERFLGFKRPNLKVRNGGNDLEDFANIDRIGELITDTNFSCVDFSSKFFQNKTDFKYIFNNKTTSKTNDTTDGDGNVKTNREDIFLTVQNISSLPWLVRVRYLEQEVCKAVILTKRILVAGPECMYLKMNYKKAANFSVQLINGSIISKLELLPVRLQNSRDVPGVRVPKFVAIKIFEDLIFDGDFESKPICSPKSPIQFDENLRCLIAFSNGDGSTMRENIELELTSNLSQCSNKNHSFEMRNICYKKSVGANDRRPNNVRQSSTLFCIEDEKLYLRGLGDMPVFAANETIYSFLNFFPYI